MLTKRLNLAVMCLGLMIAPALHAQMHQMSVVNAKVERGQAAAAKVHAMIAKNPHLQKAIGRLEARGTHSHVEDATIITGIAVPSGTTTTSALSVGATATVSGDNIEITFIPNTYYYGYWDGTVDAKRYDSNGVLVDEYVGNVTGTSSDPSQGLDTVYEDVVYAYDYWGDGAGGGGGGGDEEMMMGVGKPDELRARPRSLNPREPRDGHPVKALRWLGRWGDWGKCSGAWCVGAAAGCGVANAMDAEIGWLPCTAVGCIGGAIGCTYGTLWN